MARILCIEAGTDVGSVALGENGKLVSLRENTEGREHARNLAVYVDEILRENDLDATDLDAIAIGKGPGSYTGLRICTALAKGLCYGAQIPLIAIGSLEALCRVALEDYEAGVLDLEEIQGSILLPMIDARRMEVYCQLFDEQARPLSEAEAHVLTSESFLPQRNSDHPLVLFGNGAAKSKTLFTEPHVHYVEVIPSARGLIKPAFDAFKNAHFEDIAYFEPFYLKDFLITPSSKKLF